MHFGGCQDQTISKIPFDSYMTSIKSYLKTFKIEVLGKNFKQMSNVEASLLIKILIEITVGSHAVVRSTTEIPRALCAVSPDPWFPPDLEDCITTKKPVLIQLTDLTEIPQFYLFQFVYIVFRCP